MAERVGREGPSRRSSLRKAIADDSLPPEFLETLEKKRKQLDESIHRYIASKEREYKQFEKDLRAQCKARNGQAQQQIVAEAATKRRIPFESSQDTSASPALSGQSCAMSAVDALLANGTRRDTDRHVTQKDELLAHGEQRTSDTGLPDRRPSTDHEKQFVGVFTPPFLPAIDGKDGKDGRQLERSESAPPSIELSSADGDGLLSGALPRAESDTAVVSSPRARRPMQLQLAQRTSSSGSSADGRLASAMKSPTHALRRPKRKRVSLAVGDSIVAPSEEVPPSFSNNKTPSHSRTRSPATELDRTSAEQSAPNVSTAEIPTRTRAENTHTVAEAGVGSSIQSIDMQPSAESQSKAEPTAHSKGSNIGPPVSRKSSIDPDGDLFDLEEEEARLSSLDNLDDTEPTLTGEHDTITGRIERGQQNRERLGLSSVQQEGNYDYDPEGGLVPEPAPVVTSAIDDDDTATHLDYGPNSAVASQQPTKPGFRRPSVVTDPMFRGTGYDNAEAKAVEDEVYGSSFARPTTKGSFTSGSLGESYMVKHAERMMELRMAKREQDVRT